MNAYNEIISLPETVLSDTKSAVILPIFFYDKTRVLDHCYGLKACAMLYVLLTYSLIYRGLNLMPRNKTELKACIYHRLCQARKPNIRTHVMFFLVILF